MNSINNSGAIPNVDYLMDSGINLDGNLVIVDKTFKTNIDDVYAGGDLVKFPYKNSLINVGHWQTSQAHGIINFINTL